MAVRMAGLRRTKSGSWTSRKYVPEDIRSTYEALYTKRWEEIFRAPAGCPLSTAKRLHSEWEGEIDSRIAALRAKQRGEGHDLTQRDAQALAGEWYKWFTGLHEENPGQPGRWAKLSESLTDLIVDVAGDPETGEIDMDAPEVREELHPLIADGG